MSGDMNSEAFRAARNAIIDARNGDVCGGQHTGCEQDGEVCPDGTMDQWIDHGPECPTRRAAVCAGQHGCDHGLGICGATFPPTEGRCGFCHRVFRTVSNGRLPLHGPVDARCLGSP